MTRRVRLLHPQATGIAYSMTAPKDESEFASWSSEATCGVFGPQTRNWYTSNQNNAWSELLLTDFFAKLGQTIKTAALSYEHDFNAKLFALDRIPQAIEWHRKSYASFLNKLFRVNCVENRNFPNPPNEGWRTVQRSFEEIDDIVRTTVVVAYADGPAHLAGAIAESAMAHGLKVKIKDHAQEKGYYAHHVYVYLPLEISSLVSLGEYPRIEMPVEIQITTELQGVLREITHRLYEGERNVGALAADWKNQFESGRFRAAYMAHSLRFIEAMIVDLRRTTQPKAGA